MVPTRTIGKCQNWVGKNARCTGLRVVPFEEHEEGTGMSRPFTALVNAERPGEYRNPIAQARRPVHAVNAESNRLSRSLAGSTILQVAVGQSCPKACTRSTQNHLVSQGPGEGWARYSESIGRGKWAFTRPPPAPIKTSAPGPPGGIGRRPGHSPVLAGTREEAKEFMK